MRVYIYIYICVYHVATFCNKKVMTKIVSNHRKQKQGQNLYRSQRSWSECSRRHGDNATCGWGLGFRV